VAQVYQDKPYKKMGSFGKGLISVVICLILLQRKKIAMEGYGKWI
jgi:hypothetical protein